MEALRVSRSSGRNSEEVAKFGDRGLECPSFGLVPDAPDEAVFDMGPGLQPHLLFLDLAVWRKLQLYLEGTYVSRKRSLLETGLEGLPVGRKRPSYPEEAGVVPAPRTKGQLQPAPLVVSCFTLARSLRNERVRLPPGGCWKR